jgi:hypothetical protein
MGVPDWTTLRAATCKLSRWPASRSHSSATRATLSGGPKAHLVHSQEGKVCPLVERRMNRRDPRPQQRTASLRQLTSGHLNSSPTASPLRCSPNSEPPPCTATNATTRSSTTPRTRGRSTPCWTGSSPPVGDTLTDVGLPMHFLDRSEDPTDPRRHPPTRIPRPRRGGWPGTPPPPAWTSDMSCLPSLYPLQVCRDLLSGRGPAAGVMSGQDFGNLNHEIRQQGNSGPAV